MNSSDRPIQQKVDALPKVMFLCRGSVKDGMGHVTRSRSVAAEMQTFATVKFVVVGDRCVESLIARRNLDYVILATEEAALEFWHQFNPDIVIFDLLYIEEAIFDKLSHSHATVSLSPIFNHLGKVDLIFHRTAIRGQDWSLDVHKPIVYSGLDYAVIGEHCHRIPDYVYEHNLDTEPLSIAISMGGADAANKTLQVLETVKSIDRKLLLWVMLGEGYTHSYQDLVDSMRDSNHEIILAKTNDSMWRILSTCALVILAGGTTTYEAAYAGLPSINTLESEKHFFLVKELIDKEICFCAGKSFEASLHYLNRLIENLSDRPHLLRNMHENSKAMIDGKGAERIVKSINEYYQKNF